MTRATSSTSRASWATTPHVTQNLDAPGRQRDRRRAPRAMRATRMSQHARPRIEPAFGWLKTWMVCGMNTRSGDRVQSVMVNWRRGGKTVVHDQKDNAVCRETERGTDHLRDEAVERVDLVEAAAAKPWARMIEWPSSSGSAAPAC